MFVLYIVAFVVIFSAYNDDYIDIMVYKLAKRKLNAWIFNGLA